MPPAGPRCELCLCPRRESRRLDPRTAGRRGPAARRGPAPRPLSRRTASSERDVDARTLFHDPSNRREELVAPPFVVDPMPRRIVPREVPCARRRREPYLPSGPLRIDDALLATRKRKRHHVARHLAVDEDRKST